ncbi:MAG TPA: penicillin-binding transpeptidase domain-containing protein [Pyrinomonadaceae bacterium]|nr:penicillin-binding transpeptidase domain-containing protein [Pyrinomonadaceae bacterium]
MTPKFRFPRIALALSALLIFTAASAQAAAKKPAKKPAAKAAAKAPSRSKRGGRETAAARKDSRASKRERAAEARRGRNAKADRRGAKSERAERKGKKGRAEERAERVSKKDSRRMSRRERLAAARAEAERRRREAAERARQIALAIARRRAADQALKDETAANILKDETTGEDLTVRRAALDALGDRAGTVVVMNPKTGQVYTVVNQDWGLRRGFKPCSTIKLVSGLAGLNEGVIDPVQTVNIGTSSFSLDLTDSLAYSNNGYFQRVGGQVGFPKMMEYAKKFGLGEPTGINHPSESPGRLPVFKEGYAVNHMSSHGDDIEVTAIQLARMASAIANGGKLLVPHLPRTPQENVNFKREVKRELQVNEDNLRRLVPGMIGAVSYGTAKRAAAPAFTVAGKTGTCTGQGSKLGLFTSYGPVQDPTLAVAVILRNSSTGGKWAAAVAGDVYRRLGFDARFAPKPGSRPMLANDMVAPRPHIDPRKAAEVSDEEREDDEAEANAKAEDAFVVSTNDEATGTQRPALQKTSKTSERPAATPSPAPAPNGNTAAPAANGAERPRRVSDRPE